MVMWTLKKPTTKLLLLLKINKMTFSNILKSFVYLFLASIFYFTILIILASQMPFWAGLLIMLFFLFIWKFLYGLAYLNYFILFSIFVNSFILNMAFNLTAVLVFVFLLVFLFYLRAIYQKKIIQNDQKTFIALKYLFFFIVFFSNILSLYTLFYIAYWPFTLVFFLLIITLAICLLWYQKLDDIKLSFYEGLIFLIIMSQVAWFLFNFSGGFFIFPILIVFWFYNLFNFYKNIEFLNWDKVNNWLIMPLILTLVFSFYFKI